MVLVRCRKPINHQRGLRVSISQRLVIFPASIHLKAAGGRGRGGGGGASRRGHLAERAGPANVRSSEGRGDLHLPPHAPPLALKFRGSGLGGEVGFLPARRVGSQTFVTSSVQLRLGGMGRGKFWRYPARPGEAGSLDILSWIWLYSLAENILKPK